MDSWAARVLAFLFFFVLEMRRPLGADFRQFSGLAMYLMARAGFRLLIPLPDYRHFASISAGLWIQTEPLPASRNHLILKKTHG